MGMNLPTEMLPIKMRPYGIPKHYDSSGDIETSSTASSQMSKHVDQSFM